MVAAAPRRIVQLMYTRVRQRHEPHRGAAIEGNGTVAAGGAGRPRRRADEQDTQREGRCANALHRHETSSTRDYHTNRTAASAWRPALAREATPRVAASAFVPSPDRFTVLNRLNTCTTTSARRSPARRIRLLARM